MRTILRSSILPLGCVLFFTATLPASADDGPTKDAQLSGSCHDTGAKWAFRFPGELSGDDHPFVRVTAGSLIVHSGYVQNGMPGNLLLAYTVDGK